MSDDFTNIDAEREEKEKKLTAVETQQKLGTGVKAALMVIVGGAIVAGIYVAITLAS